MHSAFRSPAALAAVVAVNVALLALPLVVGALKSPSREGAWASIPFTQGPIGNDVNATFREPGDADVLFVGSSTLAVGLLADQVQAALAQKLGRPARVRVLAVFGPGLDVPYFLLRDYLERHRVGLVVLSDPMARPTTDEPHRQMANWLRMGDDDDAFKGVKTGSRAQVYASLVLGGPRQLLSLVRPDRIGEDEKTQEAFDKTVHSLRYASYAGKRFVERTDFSPSPGFDGLLKASSPLLRLEGPAPGAYSLHFLRKVVDLAKEKGTTLGFIHMNNLDEFGRRDLPEIVDYKGLFGEDTIVFGVPFERLFAGLDHARAEDYFFDLHHFNMNGARVFTKAITPAILEAYDHAQRKDRPQP